jgi:iron(III) transport system substrate-binding protein
VRKHILAAVAAVALIGVASPAPAQVPDGVPDYYPAEYAEIVDGSRAENHLLIYSNLSADMLGPAVEGFSELYPWIEVEQLELGSSEVMERYLAEQGAGARTADILITVAADVWLNFIERGEIMPYDSPEASYYPDWSLTHPGLYNVGVDPVIFVWNKAILPEELVPTGMEDLVNKVRENPDVFTPGSLTTYGVHFGSYGYTFNYALARHHGEKIWDWYKVLGPITRSERGSGAMMEKLTTGEYKLTYFTGAAAPWLAVRDPARAEIIGWSFVDDGTPMTLRGMAIPKAATNVNAAKLFLDFLLSHAGQVDLAAGGRVPFRPDVTPEDVGGQYTYSSLLEAIGEENAVYVDYDPKLNSEHDAFQARWLEAYGE